jgi:hypothetical protein
VTWIELVGLRSYVRVLFLSPAIGRSAGGRDLARKCLVKLNFRVDFPVRGPGTFLVSPSVHCSELPSKVLSTVSVSSVKIEQLTMLR